MEQRILEWIHKNRRFVGHLTFLIGLATAAGLFIFMYMQLNNKTFFAGVVFGFFSLVVGYVVSTSLAKCLDHKLRGWK